MADAAPSRAKRTEQGGFAAEARSPLLDVEFSTSSGLSSGAVSPQGRSRVIKATDDEATVVRVLTKELARVLDDQPQWQRAARFLAYDALAPLSGPVLSYLESYPLAVNMGLMPGHSVEHRMRSLGILGRSTTFWIVLVLWLTGSSGRYHSAGDVVTMIAFTVLLTLLRGGKFVYLADVDFELQKESVLPINVLERWSLRAWVRPDAIMVKRQLALAATRHGINVDSPMFSFGFSKRRLEYYRANMVPRGRAQGEGYDRESLECMEDAWRAALPMLERGLMPGILLSSHLIHHGIAQGVHVQLVHRLSLAIAAGQVAVPFMVRVATLGWDNAWMVTFGSDNSSLLVPLVAIATAVLIMSLSYTVTMVLFGGNVDYARRARLLKALNDLIRFRDGLDTEENGLPHVCRCPPIVPLSRPHNIASWLRLRAFIKDFGLSYNRRFQLILECVVAFYIALGVIIVVGALDQTRELNRNGVDVNEAGVVYVLAAGVYNLCVVSYFILHCIVHAARANASGLEAVQTLDKIQLSLRCRIANVAMGLLHRPHPARATDGARAEESGRSGPPAAVDSTTRSSARGDSGNGGDGCEDGDVGCDTRFQRMTSGIGQEGLMRTLLPHSRSAARGALDGASAPSSPPRARRGSNHVHVTGLLISMDDYVDEGNLVFEAGAVPGVAAPGAASDGEQRRPRGESYDTDAARDVMLSTNMAELQAMDALLSGAKTSIANDDLKNPLRIVGVAISPTLLTAVASSAASLVIVGLKTLISRFAPAP